MDAASPTGWYRPSSSITASLCCAPASDIRFSAPLLSENRGSLPMRRESSASDKGTRVPGASILPGGSSVSEPADSAPSWASRAKSSLPAMFASAAMRTRRCSSGSRLSKYHCTGRDVLPSTMRPSRRGSHGDRSNPSGVSCHARVYSKRHRLRYSCRVPTVWPSMVARSERSGACRRSVATLSAADASPVLGGAGVTTCAPSSSAARATVPWQHPERRSQPADRARSAH